MQHHEALSVMLNAEQLSKWSSVKHDELVGIQRHVVATGEGLNHEETLRLLDVGKQHMLLMSGFAVLVASMLCQEAERHEAAQRGRWWLRLRRAWAVLRGRA